MNLRQAVMFATALSNEGWSVMEQAHSLFVTYDWDDINPNAAHAISKILDRHGFEEEAQELRENFTHTEEVWS